MARSLVSMAASIVLLFAVGAPVAVGVEVVAVGDVLVLGPLVRPAPVFEGEAGVRATDFVCELVPAALWPEEGDEVAWFDGSSSAWRRVGAGDAGVELPAATVRDVTFVLVYATVDRFGEAEVTVSGAGAIRLFVEGEDVAHAGEPGGSGTSVRATREFRRGTHRLLARVEREGGAGAVRVTIEPKDDARWSTATAAVHPPARYDELRDVSTPSGLQLSPDGALLAVTRRDRGRTGATWSRLEVLDMADGAVVVPALGGEGARAVAWRRDAQELLFRDGGDLFTWDRESGVVTRVLEDEPSLGPVSWSADGRSLVFLSTRGVDAKSKGGNVRRTELRERLSDWPTAPHLWHHVVESSARRRLALPADLVQDAFELLEDGRTLALLRSRPIDERPWFETQVVTLDLGSGEERIVQTLRMGFENRPGLSGFAASPDGTRVAFVGPPSELGDSATVEPNAFDPDLYVVDLATGAWKNVTAELTSSVDGHVYWTPDGTGLRFLATAGSRSELVFLRLDGIEPVAVESRSAGGERVHDVAFAGESTFAAVVSRTDRLPWLVADGRDLVLPNRPLEARWALTEPTDQSFTAEDGTPIEAWLHRPPPSARAPGKLPLLVYYYGGASATARGWNEFHAFLVGNGYALYVSNPRGANGYGAAFANHHVNDWGDRAGADVLRGVEDVLAHNDDLDASRVGCFGGSYGGFLTMSLLTRTDRFAAAVSLYGISNLASYFGDGMWGWTYGDQAMARTYPWSDAAWYARHSPLHAADRIVTPLLLLHGDEDTNVPPAESEQMFTALRLLGRPVELVRFPGEDHGLRGKWENRVAHREMMVDWFDRYLRDQPRAWEARWR